MKGTSGRKLHPFVTITGTEYLDCDVLLCSFIVNDFVLSVACQTLSKGAEWKGGVGGGGGWEREGVCVCLVMFGTLS